jgi:hypothetical protein
MKGKPLEWNIISFEERFLGLAFVHNQGVNSLLPDRHIHY